jgi:hypothetical protein
MKVKKSIDINGDILEALNAKYPGVSFTKLVERGLENLLHGADVEDMLTKDAVIRLLNTMGQQIHDMHKRLK